MMLSFGGKMPRDEGAVFVAANATVLGDVTLDRGVNIWYGAVLRADEGALILGENSNVQDNAVLHCDPGGQVVLGTMLLRILSHILLNLLIKAVPVVDTGQCISCLLYTSASLYKTIALFTAACVISFTCLYNLSRC